MILLFYYLPLLQNDTLAMSLCMQMHLYFGILLRFTHLVQLVLNEQVLVFPLRDNQELLALFKLPTFIEGINSSTLGLPDSVYAWFNIVSDICDPAPCYLNSNKLILTLSNQYCNPKLGFEPRSFSGYNQLRNDYILRMKKCQNILAFSLSTNLLLHCPLKAILST